MYKISLPNFEGPFDLLLYFIKRDEVNIYDIPISRITEEFLSYIKYIEVFDLEPVSEFILMAANLMYIKSQMLLPRQINEETGEFEDPRTHLVQKLLEYKRYKEASYQLADMHNENKYILYRRVFDADKELASSLNGLTNISVITLVNAFKRVMDKSNKTIPTHDVILEKYSIENAEKELIEHFKLNKRVKFFQLIENRSKQVLIVLFLAILELIKKQRIYIRQEDNFDDIIIGLMPALN